MSLFTRAKRLFSIAPLGWTPRLPPRMAKEKAVREYAMTQEYSMQRRKWFQNGAFYWANREKYIEMKQPFVAIAEEGKIVRFGSSESSASVELEEELRAEGMKPPFGIYVAQIGFEDFTFLNDSGGPFD